MSSTSCLDSNYHVGGVTPSDSPDANAVLGQIGALIMKSGFLSCFFLSLHDLLVLVLLSGPWAVCNLQVSKQFYSRYDNCVYVY